MVVDGKLHKDKQLTVLKNMGIDNLPTDASSGVHLNSFTIKRIQHPSGHSLVQVRK